MENKHCVFPMDDRPLNLYIFKIQTTPVSPQLSSGLRDRSTGSFILTQLNVVPLFFFFVSSYATVCCREIHQPSPSCMADVRDTLEATGFPLAITLLAAGASRSFTTGTYDSCMEHFYFWSQDHSLNPVVMSVQEPSSISSRKQAGEHDEKLLPPSKVVWGWHISWHEFCSLSNPSVWGMFNSCPQSTWLAPSRSLNSLLETFTQPLHNAPPSGLTRKMLFLVAVSSVRCTWELYACSLTPARRCAFQHFQVRLLANLQLSVRNRSPSFTPGRSSFWHSVGPHP